MVYEEYLSLSIALRPLQRVNASLNHLFYNKLIIAILFMAKCLIILLSDYSEFTTVRQDVLGSYANAVHVVNLNCLPILEGIEYNISTPSIKPTLTRRGGLSNLEVSTQCINK